MNNNLYDTLEICLQELENGADLETVLARYPAYAGELRPILKASIQARAMAVPAPSPAAVRRGRAKLLQHASEMREAKAAPRKRMIPVFQRLAISFALTALFLTSGTGLVGASSSALPGEKLYPVKLTWENVRLMFAFSHEAQEALEHAFENERLHEVSELLTEGRHETIKFDGVYTIVNGVAYVSGIQVVFLDTSVLPTEPLTDGMAVTVTGHTNAQGFVEIESIVPLPVGTVVPTALPSQLETDSDTSDENENVNVNEDISEDDQNDNLNENEDENSNDDIEDLSDDDNSDDTNDDNINDDNVNDDTNDDNNNDDNNNDDSNNDDDKKDDNNDDDKKDDNNND